MANPPSIAWDFFSSYLSDDEIKLIRATAYDINRGSNTIFLPYYDDDTEWHKLPYHCTNHPQYDNWVSKKFELMKDEAKKKAKADQDHPEVPEEMLDYLCRLRN